MIIVPEAKSVVILPPRTGSTALKKAVQELFPHSMMIYRHREPLVSHNGMGRSRSRWPVVTFYSRQHEGQAR